MLAYHPIVVLLARTAHWYLGRRRWLWVLPRRGDFRPFIDIDGQRNSLLKFSPVSLPPNLVKQFVHLQCRQQAPRNLGYVPVLGLLGKDQIVVPICHRLYLVLYILEWPLAVWINAPEVRMPWYHHGCEFFQF